MTNAFEQPRAVFALTAERHDDRALAHALTTGWFEHGGERYEFGLEPEWSADRLAGDWREALASFGWGMDLAHAYRETAEERFLATWEQLVLSWITTGRLEQDSATVIARRLEHWAYAWDTFVSAPAFESLAPGLGRRIVNSARTQVRRLRSLVGAQPSPEPDHTYALLIAALAFPGVDVSGALLTFATEALCKDLRRAQLADGALAADGVHRHRARLRPLLGLAENARRFGFGLPDDFEARVEQACDVLLHTGAAGGVGGPTGDPLLACAAELLRRGDLLWAASGGQRGVPPLVRNVSFPDGGYYVQRSGWGQTPERGEASALLDTSRARDPLSLALTIAGQTLALTTPERTGTIRPVDRCTGPGLDLLRAYTADPARGVWHAREVAFVADDYWLVHDFMHAAGDGRHELLLQFAPQAHGHTVVDVRDGSAAITAPGLAVVLAPGVGPIDVGLVTGARAQREPAPLFALGAEGTDASLTLLVLPHRPGRPVPAVEVHDSPEATVVEVHGVGPDGTATDYVAWARQPTLLALGEFRVRARAAWVRQSPDGKVLSFGASGTDMPVENVDTAPAAAVMH